MKTISTKDLKEKMDRGDKFVLIEVLGPEDFEEAHLPGAVNVPLERVMEEVPELVPQKDREVVVYCRNQACTASPMAAHQLEKHLGYTEVLDYQEGKEAWRAAGYRMETGPAE